MQTLATTRDEMITKHMNLVHMVCQRYKRRAAMVGIEYDDLAGYGSIGLIQAVDNFEQERGLAFSTYATSVISGAIRRSMRDMRDGPKVTRMVKEAIPRIASIPNWKDWTEQEMSDYWQIDQKIIKEALSFMKSGKVSSLNVIVSDGDGDKGVEIQELLITNQDDSKVFVNDFLSKLEPNVKTAVRLAMEEKTQSEIAEVLGISQMHAGRLVKQNAKRKWLAYAGQ